MARPKKNNADYFSHDNDMRNDRKIKALRTKYGITGYAVWCMLLEFLTSENDNQMKDDPVEFELVAGDFGVSVTEINDIISFCHRLGLLIREEGVLYSPSLKSRLNPVYEKRKRNNCRRNTVKKDAPDTENDNISEEPKESTSKEKQTDVDQIDYKKLVDYFNTETKGVFGIVRYPLSRQRRGMLNARIKEHGKKSFAEVIHKASNSDFLKGNNSRGFMATFDWIIRPTNFEKIITGNYDNKKKTAEQSTYVIPD